MFLGDLSCRSILRGLVVRTLFCNLATSGYHGSVGVPQSTSSVRLAFARELSVILTDPSLSCPVSEAAFALKRSWTVELPRSASSDRNSGVSLLPFAFSHTEPHSMSCRPPLAFSGGESGFTHVFPVESALCGGRTEGLVLGGSAGPQRPSSLGTVWLTATAILSGGICGRENSRTIGFCILVQ